MAKLLIILTLLVIIAAVWISRFIQLDQIPHLDPEEWWGPKELKELNDISVRPYKVEFGEEVISDLKHRINNFRAPPPPLEGVAFEYGFNSNQLDAWRRYWAEDYDFREREEFLNKYPQFKTNIQGLDIHFIRVKPALLPGVKILPLLILHGWPGSVREFYELIPLLSNPYPGYNFIFEVIAPSLPGFGFSDAAVRPGLGGPQMAVILRNLMRRIGHEQFYIQAGDWGAEIASDLAILHPEDVLGFHTNLPIVKHPVALLMTGLSAAIPSWTVEGPLQNRMHRFPNLMKELGYFHLQASKPDTIGAALTDSPLGLLAYILEKFSVATNYYYVNRPDGGLEEKFTKNQLLDNLMIYWVTGKITSSFRLYREGFGQVLSRWRLNLHPTPVPTWALQAEYEILYQMPSAIRYKFPNLVNVTVANEGGHFIALEKPELLAADVFRAVDGFIEFNKNKDFMIMV